MFDKIKAFLAGSGVTATVDVANANANAQPVQAPALTPVVAGFEGTMSSREIAELTGKALHHVHRDIATVLKALKDYPNLDHEEFQAFRDVRGYISEYRLTKKQTLLIMSGYSVVLRARIIDRWEKLEQQLRNPAPQQVDKATMTLMVIEDLMTQAETAKAMLVEAAPKVEFVENYVEAEGLMGFREVNKLIGSKEREFRAWLVANKVMYKGTSGWLAHQPHLAAGRFEHKTFYDVYGRAQVQAYFTAKGVEYVLRKIKGE